MVLEGMRRYVNVECWNISWKMEVVWYERALAQVVSNFPLNGNGQGFKS